MIDGANFYLLALDKIGVRDLEFDFNAFADFLAAGRKISTYGKRYYIGTVREKEGDPKSKLAMSRQTSFLSRLKNSGWETKTSKHRTRTETVVIDSRVENWEEIIKKGISSLTFERNREKGIDVKIATDLIVGAVDNQYDTVIIVSSDTDLIPAIDWIRMRYKKKVEYIGFSIPNPTDEKKSTRPIVAMFSKTDSQEY